MGRVGVGKRSESSPTPGGRPRWRIEPYAATGSHLAQNQATHWARVYVVHAHAPRQSQPDAISIAPNLLTAQAGDRERTHHLTVFHCNDIHHHAGSADRGLAAMAARVTEARAETRAETRAVARAVARAEAQRDAAHSVLFLGAGDDVTGGPLDILLEQGLLGQGAGDAAFQRIHAAYAIYGAMGLDACGVGNHDLDRGVSVLAARARQAAFPLLAANLRLPDRVSRRVAAAAIFVRAGLRVGVIGVTTAGQLSPLAAAEVEVDDPVTTVAELASFLAPYTDVRVVLSHLGLTVLSRSAVVEPVGDRELAHALPPGSVHLIVGGHTHDSLNLNGLDGGNVVNGAPIVHAGAFGAWLGQVDLRVQTVPQAGRAAQVTVEDARLHPTTATESQKAHAEQFYRHAVEPLVLQAQTRLREPLTQVADLAGMDSQMWQDRFESGEIAAANFVADLIVQAAQDAGHAVDFAAVDRSVLTGGFAPGVLTLGQWIGMMPHADVIELIDVPGDALASFLLDNLRRAQAGSEAGFVHCSRALRYVGVCDVGPAGERMWGTWRLAEASLRGVALDQHVPASVCVALPSFTRVAARAWEQGAAGAMFRLNDFPRRQTGLQVRTALASILRALGRVDEAHGARTDGRLKILGRSG